MVPQPVGTVHKRARRVRAGSVWINPHNSNDVALPLVRHKPSKRAREMGKQVLELYTETKAVAAML
jgi:phenylacetaldehyde dehydrogenase